MNIKTKTLFWFLFPSVLIAAVAALVCYFYTVNTVKQNIFNQLEMAADEIKEDVYAFLREKRGRVLDFSSDGFIRSCTEEITGKDSRREYYTEALNNHLMLNKKSLDPDILEVSVADFKGEVIASTDKNQVGKDISDQNYFTCVEYLCAFAGGPHYDSSLKAIVIDFSTVLLSKIGQEAIGIIVNRVRYDQYRNIEQGDINFPQNVERDYFELVAVNKVRVVDFGSDGFIRDYTEEITRREDRVHYYTSSLNIHLTSNKMPLDHELIAVFVVDLTGKIIGSSEFGLMGRNVSDEIYFSKTLEKGSYVSCLHSPVGFKYNTFEVANLLLDKKGQRPVGIIVNRYNGSGFRNVTRSGISLLEHGKQLMGLGETGEIYIVNGDKLMITESRFISKAILKQVVDTEGVRAAFENRKGMVGIYPDYRGILILGVSRYIDEMDWVVLAEKDVSEAFAPLAQLRYFCIIMGVVGVIVIVIVAAVLSDRIVSPIKKLIEGTKRVASGDLEQTIKVGKRKDEIKELSVSFNTMIKELKESTIENRDLFLQVERNRDEWKSTFDAITDIITIHDKDSRIIMANKAFFEKFGVTGKVLLDKKYYEVFYNTDKPLNNCPLVRTLTSLLPEHEEMYIPKISGTFLTSAYPLLGKNKKIYGIVHVAKDVTFQKKLQTQLIDKASTLERVNRELEDFIYIISHDLKEPLFSIEGFRSRLFKGYKGILDEKGTKYLERIGANVDNMSKKICEIMEVVKIGRVAYNFEINDVKALVNNVIKTLENKIDENHIKVLNQNNLPGELFCDKNRLKDVFSNLIINAIKYMGDDNKKEIKIGCNRDGGYYKFFVEDTGIGIRKEFQDQIFKMFRRLNDVEMEGTGVGLTIVKKIVELHNGKVWIESPVHNGKGSRFCFSIPFNKKVESRE